MISHDDVADLVPQIDNQIWRYVAQEVLRKSELAAGARLEQRRVIMSIDPAAPDEGIRIEPRESIRRRILGL